MTVQAKILHVVKALIAAYVFTGIALAILAFMVYKFTLGEAVVNVVIILIYVLSSFLGAFLTGKKIKEKKFLWGLLLGAIYIIIICIASAIITKDFNLLSTTTISAFALCIGGGLLGGMLS